MTAVTVPPGRLLSVAEFARLGEDDRTRWELQEGSLVMSPSPTPQHMVAVAELYSQVRRQLPDSLRAVPDVDLDVELTPDGQPGTVRRPDLVVVETDEFERVGREGGLLRAASTRLVVEVVSPGSRRTDTLIKRGEYADAGIPFYWIVELAPEPTVVECQLAGPFGCQDAGTRTGRIDVAGPVPMRLDLTSLA